MEHAIIENGTNKYTSFNVNILIDYIKFILRTTNQINMIR
jgi:hypothetical protein